MADNPDTREAHSHDLVLSRVFDAPVERVWEGWTQPEYVKQWWGPTGFTCPLADMDVREGGRSLVCMRAPEEYGAGDMYNTWTYTRVVPNKRLEYILNFTDKNGNALNPTDLGLSPGIPRDVPHEIIFKDLGNGTTEVTVKEFGYSTEQERELSMQGMEQCLDKMATLFSRP